MTSRPRPDRPSSGPGTSTGRPSSTSDSPPPSRSSTIANPPPASTPWPIAPSPSAGPRERVVIIDDDLGKSGQSIEGRPGFQRLLAEVALDHVGLILGLEMSRLARSCKDWHQLLELCAPLPGAPGRRRRPLRPDRLQRPAPAGPERDHERGGAAYPQGADVPGQAEQGPPRRDARHARRSATSGSPAGEWAIDPDEQVQARRPPDLRRVRPAGDAARPAPLPGPSRDPHAGRGRTAGPNRGATRVAAAEPGDAAEPAAPPDLRRGLPLRASADRSAPQAARAGRPPAADPPAGGVPGADPRPRCPAYITWMLQP